MEFNKYQLNKRYKINLLKHYWLTRENHGIKTCLYKNYIIFRSTPLDSDYILISKINYCVRACIKMKLINIILEKVFTKKYPHLQFENGIKTSIMQYIGYFDNLYRVHVKRDKNINNYGFDVELLDKK